MNSWVLKRISILFFILIFWNSSLLGLETGNYNFIHLSVNEGLSHNTIRCIFQDRQGKIWVGTGGGLNSYDGYDVSVYYSLFNDSTSLPGNQISSVAEDINGNLWVATNQGICRFLPDKNVFKRYRELEGVVCQSLLRDHNGTLWLGTAHGLFVYDDEYDTFERLSNLKWQGKELRGMPLLCEYKPGILVFSSLENLFVYEVERGEVNKVQIWGDHPRDSEERSYVAATWDLNGNFWVGQSMGGLFLLERQGLQWVLREKYAHYFGSNPVRDILCDYKGQLWVGTYKGLYILRGGDPDILITPNKENPMGLSYQSVVNLMKDRDNSIWIGTYFGGVNIFRERNNTFKSIWPSNQASRMKHNSIRGIAKDPKGNIWFGTQGSGIAIFDPKTKIVKPFDYKGFENKNIHALYLDRFNRMWIGTFKAGIFIYDFNTRRLHRVKLWKDDMVDVSQILSDNSGRIWIGTYSHGLKVVELTGNGLEDYRTVITHPKGMRSRIITLATMKNGNVCIGASSEFWHYSTKEKRFYPHYNGSDPNSLIGNNDIYSLYEDSWGILWIGTNGGGVITLEPRDQKMKRFSLEEGLVNNTVYGITEDRNGRMWLSTNKGLVSFRKDFSNMNSYTVKDGIPSNQFSLNAVFASSSDDFYFGTINGLTYFNPYTISKDTIPLAAHIRSVKVLDKQISITGSKELKGGQKDGVVLDYEERNFTVEFLAHYYGATSNLKYAYRLGNFSSDWTETSLREVSYTNLDSGDYLFEVKAANPDGIWSLEPTSLAITILAPWYQTTQAYLLYLVIGVLLILGALKIYQDRLRVLNEARISRMEREKEEEVHQLKLRFFTNISHEFRTPLSLISGPLESLQTLERNKEKKQLIEMASRNTNRLLHLVNSILDFRKADSGFLSLDLTKSDFGEFIRNQVNAFAESARQKEVTVRAEIDSDLNLFVFDTLKMSSVFYNLLGNALKYSGKGDRIEVEALKIGKRGVIIRITDTGVGIPAVQISKIFERFYQATDNSVNQIQGSGIGLAFTKEIINLHGGRISVESEEGKGTQFIVELPLLPEPALQKAKGDAGKEELTVPMETNVELEEVCGPDKAPSILVVDDNRDLLAFLSSFLQKEYRVIVAENGKMGLERLYQYNPDIIISDVMMPVMDGITFCKRVKTNIETSHIPLILLSAKEAILDQIEGLESGADVYVSKPFSIRFLKAQVHNLLRGRRQLHDQFTSPEQVKTEELQISSVDKKFMNRVIELIDGKLDDQKLSTDTLSEEMAMSTSTLYRKIKAITGKGSNEYIRTYRLQKAIELMREGESSITEIAYKVGFNTPSYFTKSFKKEYGVLPKDYFKK